MMKVHKHRVCSISCN